MTLLDPACPACAGPTGLPCRAHLGAALADLREPVQCECCKETECDCDVQPFTDRMLKMRLPGDKGLGLICLLHRKFW